MSLQPFRKKDKQAYMEQERKFAKKHGMKQTISSGRIGIMKGDSYDSVFVVDNKQTMAWEYGLDSRDWEAFAKRALMTRRIPLLEIAFARPHFEEPVRVVVMPYDDWERMYKASGWGIERNDNDNRRSAGKSQQRSYQTATSTKRSRRT